MRQVVQKTEGQSTTCRLVAVVIAIVLAGCSGGDEHQVAAPVVDSTTTPTITAPAPTTTEPAPATTTNEWELGEGSWVATAIGDGVPSYSAPNDELPADWFFPSPTQFDGPRVFRVLSATEDFYEVMIPVQPNGSTGWIPKSDVTLSEVTHRAEVNLTDDSLTVWDGDEVIVQTSAATGKTSTPTPVGEFFVRDVIQKSPSSAYGSYILGLSGFSETLDSFNGGEPAIAIHGTNRPDLIGEEVSNGCIRIPNELVELLAVTVPLGTPVSVVA